MTKSFTKMMDLWVIYNDIVEGLRVQTKEQAQNQKRITGALLGLEARFGEDFSEGEKDSF